MSIRATAALVTVLILAPVQGQALPGKAAQKQAAAQFERGQDLYNKGQFAEAIRAFSRANQLAPHWRSLFNIARCYENLGDAARALELYDQALSAPGLDTPSQVDIHQRMKRLRARPVKVFVSTRPTEARVTVDGRAGPEEGVTPMVIGLPPGDHVLLVQKDGYQLAARRIVVEMDKELPVEVALEPQPEPCKPCPAPVPCPRPRPCPIPERRVDLHNLHVHLHLLGAFGFTTDRPWAGGGGVQLLMTYRRLVFGGHFLALPMGEEQMSGTFAQIETLERRNFFWLFGQFEGGYAFPFDNFYIYTTGAVGASADRVVFQGKGKDDTDESITREKFAFTWSVGGGIEAMATRWLSFGGAIRFGMAHGRRVSEDDPAGGEYESVNAPFVTIWGAVSFHL